MPRKEKDAAFEQLLRKIKEHFGIPEEAFCDFELYERKKGEFWMTSKDALFFELPLQSRCGFKFAQLFSRGGFRLSSHAVQLLGALATRNVVELTRSEMEAFIRGEDLENRWEGLRGQVIVRYRGVPLGCAVVVESRLKNQVPSSKRIKR